jgi:hypothetical protein
MRHMHLVGGRPESDWSSGETVRLKIPFSVFHRSRDCWQGSKRGVPGQRVKQIVEKLGECQEYVNTFGGLLCSPFFVMSIFRQCL